MRRRTLLLLVSLLGCAADPIGNARTPVKTTAKAAHADDPAASTSTSTKAAPPPEDPVLRARLASEKLSGTVVAQPRALYFPTVEAARAAPRAYHDELPRGTEGLVERGEELDVVEDLGPIVKVTGGVGKLELTFFVRRETLMPVVRTARLVSFDDGTAVVLGAGLVVAPVVGGPRPLNALVATALDKPLAADEVGLSFTSTSKLPLLEALDRSQPAGPDLACDSEVIDHDIVARVEPAQAMIDRRVAEARAKNPNEWLGSPPRVEDLRPSCNLVQSTALYRGVVDADLSVHGKIIGKASESKNDGCGDYVRARAIPGSDQGALVTFHVRNASLRVRTRTTALVKMGGCGMALGRDPTTTRALKANAAVYFPGGAKAGKNTSSAAKLGGIGPSVEGRDGRTCVKAPKVSEPLCFDEADLTEVVDRN